MLFLSSIIQCQRQNVPLNYIYTQRERERILQVLEDRNDRKSIEDKRNKVKEKRICK